MTAEADKGSHVFTSLVFACVGSAGSRFEKTSSMHTVLAAQVWILTEGGLVIFYDAWGSLSKLELTVLYVKV